MNSKASLLSLPATLSKSQDGTFTFKGAAVRPLCTLEQLSIWVTPNNVVSQRSEQQQFLFETTVQATVKEVLASAVTIHNLRQTVTKLKLEGVELAKYGPAKHPDKQGIDTYDENAPQKGEFYTMDPTGRRTGNGKAGSCECARFKDIRLLTLLDRVQHAIQSSQRFCCGF